MVHWDKILLTPETSLDDAIKVLHEGGYRIALVVDTKNRLLGTLTDGDIRRALMQHRSMNDAVQRVMNNSPVTAKETDSSREILLAMKSQSLLHMPVVDGNNVLVGMKTLQDLINRVTYDNPVFLMAGGFGTRLQPLTNKVPKPLLNVGGKPILETILLQFIESGFRNFFISTHYKAEMIREHFGDGSRWGVNITYIHEEEPLGTAGSLGLLPDSLPDLPIIIMNGDILTRVNFSSLLDFHNESDGVATMCVREYDFQVPYGVIQSDESKVTGIVEKPVHSFFVNAGIYVLNSSLVQSVAKAFYLDMPHLLDESINKGEVVNMFPIYEYWLDIGHKDQYILANQDIDSFD